MRSSLSATRCRPRRSNRVITSPTRRRCTPSGLTSTRVRSRLTARKSDTRASDCDCLCESRLAAEGSYHRRAQSGGEQTTGQRLHFTGLYRVDSSHQFLGLGDRSLEQELLPRVLAERRGALQPKQEATLGVFLCLGELGVADRLL